MLKAIIPILLFLASVAHSAGFDSYPAIGSTDGDELALVLDDPGGTPATAKITVDEIATYILGYDSGTITADAPVLDLSQTWNNGAGLFTAVKLDITNTASNGSSLLMDMQVDGGSKFSVSRNGYVSGIKYLVKNSSNQDVATLRVLASNGQLTINSAGYIGFTDSAGDADKGADTTLYRDAANTLALRNSTNAQTMNFYNTYTDASNYERGYAKWDSNIFEIGTEAAGTGTNRQLILNSASSAGIDLEVGGTKIAGITPTYVLSKKHLRLGSSGDAGIDRAAAAVVQVTDGSTGNGAITFSYGQAAEAYTVATLPGTPAVGMIARVTDANAPAVGSTVAGSGAAAALVWYNGSNWTVIGI